ncbi:MAG: hypothetical protein JWM82_455, partial [Myxococcales bacterium]|nr:hypothetical protein [Myxococcales bacterium]
PGVTHARRAAGMAWNAVLAAAPDDAATDALIARFGRSYMEHVAALAAADDVPAEVSEAARRLRDTPPAPPALITLGKPDLGALDAATLITAHARERSTDATESGLATSTRTDRS